MIFKRSTVGHPDCPIMERSMVAIKGFSFRLHRFYPNHREKYAHDHPWWFVTLVIKGGYTDLKYVDGELVAMDVLRRGSLRFRSGSHAHKTIGSSAGATTVVITGRLLREWGFWVTKAIGRAPMFISHRDYRSGPWARAACDHRTP